MEYENIGSHCEFPHCGQKDFLPFTCDKCHQTFCADHRKYSDHHCSRHDPHEEDRLVPQCPLCRQFIPLLPGEDANVKISRHIDRGCPRESATVEAPSSQLASTFLPFSSASPRSAAAAAALARATGTAAVQQQQPLRPCAFAHCKASPSAVKVQCKSCHQLFCMEHRIETDHKCTGSLAVVNRHALANTLTRSIQQPRQQDQQQQQQQQQHQQQQQRDPSPSNSGITKGYIVKCAEGTKRTDAVAASSNIEFADRFYLHVVYPKGSKVPVRRFCVSKKWVLGKVLDFVAQHAGLRNDNNKTAVGATADAETDAKLRFFNLHHIAESAETTHVEPMPLSIPLKDFGDQILPSSAAVLLERGTRSVSLPLALALKKELQDKKCSVQ